ncbi:MAG: nitroreductase family protein [Zymomonas mobilis subsp. pomaceae]|uniref:Nitroreductase n=1 Tax=Zymomonas mobilis subsp. pomaceae (strain ATCC 29192 / DSM 22645 / JCM 10191 / CCUG 17912 / NBRC 13757 / NCIMB 11200 / NRRL B-4491 / Barker I) TaxID=579138 RepID=F8EVX7_ZYMMT|nr:nitroreductase family protein [Zymomonas mobilis]AEI37454.1 nitroreductase [Zymomonas mobilis subsp. pomaceae ATCC 29192]MDX5948821.1 nitroreductase family protein [Zymomonas mobilis subsp. pomaceae]GEB88629.1 nitroreductase [Zymomonas mobilis subsp. pomaceae]
MPASDLDNKQALARIADYPIDPVFLKRWSPLSFTSEKISEQTLFSLLEAARWTPSAYNSQPWRFVYAMRDTEFWPQFIDLLFEGNRSWASQAAAIIFIISRTILKSPNSDKEQHAPSHSFDAGAAWMAMALQATQMGLATRPMTGVYFDKAREMLNVPECYHLDAAIAVGHPSPTAQLEESHFKRMKFSNLRRPIHEMTGEGYFKIK